MQGIFLEMLAKMKQQLGKKTLNASTFETLAKRIQQLGKKTLNAKYFFRDARNAERMRRSILEYVTEHE